MTDIVERLRMGLATPIELEAADEIERLRWLLQDMFDELPADPVAELPTPLKRRIREALGDE